MLLIYDQLFLAAVYVTKRESCQYQMQSVLKILVKGVFSLFDLSFRFFAFSPQIFFTIVRVSRVLGHLISNFVCKLLN
jgi:hypothetical protein